MSIEDMKLKIPGLKLTAGQLLDISIFGIDVRVPPADMTLIPDLEIDLAPLWNVIMSILDSMAAEFYEKHKEE